MKAETQKEHRWLQQLLGDWTFTSEVDMGPGQAACKSSGHEKVSRLGELWVIGESQGGMPDGGQADMRITLGYETRKKAFVGNWVGSMMSDMFVYTGQLDAGGEVLTLDTEGPSFTDEASTARYQDVITLISPDERTLHSQALQPDGSWKRFMLATYRRVKQV